MGTDTVMLCVLYEAIALALILTGIAILSRIGKQAKAKEYEFTRYKKLEVALMKGEIKCLACRNRFYWPIGGIIKYCPVCGVCLNIREEDADNAGHY